MKYIFAIDQYSYIIRILPCTISQEDLEYAYTVGKQRSNLYAVDVCPGESDEVTNVLDCNGDITDLQLYDSMADAIKAAKACLSYMKLGEGR